MKIGIIGSSEGSVLKEVMKILADVPGGDYEFCVITDRECGMEQIRGVRQARCQRIEDKDNTSFSIKAARIFDAFGGVDFIVLFFLRMVNRELFSRYPLAPGDESFSFLNPVRGQAVLDSFGTSPMSLQTLCERESCCSIQTLICRAILIFSISSQGKTGLVN